MTIKDEYAGISDPYAVAESVHKPDGHILIDNRVAADTLRCSHCGGHFMVMRGSGIQRGWCHRCAGPLCGHHGCETCTPFQAWLDEVERKASREARGL